MKLSPKLKSIWRTVLFYFIFYGSLFCIFMVEMYLVKKVFQYIPDEKDLIIEHYAGVDMSGADASGVALVSGPPKPITNDGVKSALFNANSGYDTIIGTFIDQINAQKILESKISKTSATDASGSTTSTSTSSSTSTST